MSAHEALSNGNVDEALQKLRDEVRSEPSEPRHRIFLFQLLCIAGDWERGIRVPVMKKHIRRVCLFIAGEPFEVDRVVVNGGGKTGKKRR